MQKIFHTPEGVRDIYDRECERKRVLEGRIGRVFKSHGFREIQTPTFEFFEVFSNEVGTIPSRDLYKFFDREGNTMVLRPDFTPSMARACATYYQPDQTPVSLSYTGSAFINHSGMRGKFSETTQMGVERMGDASADSDAEILAMMVESLLAAGLTEFQVSVGQVEYFKSLLKEAEVSRETELRLRELISQKNEFAVEELVKELPIRKELGEALAALPQLFGSVAVLERARALTDNEEALRAVARLEEIYELMKVYGYEKYLSFDFGMLSKYQYYTGVIFQAYTYGTGEPVIKGGRYDDLLKHFGTSAPAIGFVIVIDHLLLALSGQKLSLPREDEPRVIEYGPEEREEAIRAAQKLRAEGRSVLLRCKKEED